MSYARFRADPTKVRVSIRHHPKWWSVSITAREDPGRYARIGVNNPSPRKALVIALRMAEKSKLPGIDLDLQWAYDHPHR